MFGRRWSAKAEALRDEVRAKLAANAHERALLADAITKLEATLASDLERRSHVQTSTELAVTGLREEIGGQGAELADAVQQMARMCALLAEHIDSERVERKALVDAVNVLARQVVEGTAIVSRPPRVLGGSVYSGTTRRDDDNDDDEIVLFDDASERTTHWSPLAIGVPVRCRFGDGWIDGLEICDMTGDGPSVRYRLRRAVDQYVLPPLFVRREIEPVDDAPAPDDSPEQWSSS